MAFPQRAFSSPTVRCLGVALALFAVVAVAGVLLRPLLPVDETRYMSVAWEMWRSGDYLLPHMNGALYPHKPPLLFWLIDLLWAVTGVSEIAGRLVGPVAALAAIALTALLGRRLWPDDSRAAGRAALVLASSVLFLAYGSLLMFDALLTAAALVSLIALVEAWRSGRRRWWLLYGLGIGLGVLTKGPVILVHVLPAALLMPLWTGRAARPPLRAWYLGLLLGLATGLAVVLPWLLPAVLAGGAEYRDAILWQQSAGRIVNAFAHREPVWFFIALLPVILWPWLWWPPLWQPLRARLAEADPMLRLCLVWAGSSLVVLSLISGKQLHYVLPILPAVALVVGRVIGGLHQAPRAGILPALLPLVVMLAVLLAIAGEMVELGSLNAMEEAIELQFTLLRPWLLAVPLLLGAVLLAARHWQAVAAVAPLFVAVVLVFGVKPLDPFYDGSAFARILRDRQDQGLAYIGGHYQGEFTFLGRLHVAVTDLQYPQELADWIEAHPRGTIIGSSKTLAPDWPPVLSERYRGGRYGVWFVSRAATGRGLADGRSADRPAVGPTPAGPRAEAGWSAPFLPRVQSLW